MNTYFTEQVSQHKVFVSYHHANDQYYKNLFEEMFVNNAHIMISKSVQIGDIDPTLKTETIRRKIREEYLGNSTVTVVLVGKETWKRRHVDWEIGASLRHTSQHKRLGLLGILLPTYPYIRPNTYDHYTIPPRLYDNIKRGYAKIYNWSTNEISVQQWIDDAFKRRFEVEPDNSYPSYVYNKSGVRWSPA